MEMSEGKTVGAEGAGAEDPKESAQQ